MHTSNTPSQPPTDPPLGRDPDEQTYLAMLGTTVRRLRSEHGLSRKALANASGISERYIAQLEGGQGNLSVLFLRRIAAAIGVPLDILLAGEGKQPSQWRDFAPLLSAATPARLAAARAILADTPGTCPPSLPRGQRVALIGLRGAGKSTLGRLVAERLGWNFVELNREIEREAGFTVTEIFAIYGQDGFRRHEQAALRTVLARPGPLILATGGGIVSETVTFDLLLSSLYTIWIRASPAEHMERVRAQGDLRPMDSTRSAMSELVAILSSREPLYRRADATVDTSGNGIDASVTELRRVITEHAGGPPEC
jgi:XRE family aerobic/anaerobic benzoate catabolism transcriptional regulator